MNTKLIMHIALVTGIMLTAALAQPTPRPVPEDEEKSIARAMEDARRAMEDIKRVRILGDETPMPAIKERLAMTEDMQRAVEEMKRARMIAAEKPELGVEQMQLMKEQVRRAEQDMKRAYMFAETPMAIQEDLQVIKEMGLMAMQQVPPKPPAPAAAPAPAMAPFPVKISTRGNDEDRLYRNGKSSLEGREWERAVEYFQRIIEQKGARADAAMYWKAYAQNKLGRRNEAAATLAEMMSLHPSSRWLDDAKALEVEVKQSAGQPVSPESEADEDLKILALNGMIHTDPDRALPVLEKLLQKGSSPRLKDRAVFVLAQSKSPKSREILLKLARGGVNPDLQYKAVEYLGYQSTPETRQALSELYGSTNDVQLKRAVLRGFTASRDKERLLSAAKGEQSPELRREAIRGLGNIDANAELWQLYQNETANEIKMEILRALPGRRDNIDKLVEVARAEKDSSIRAELMRQIGYARAGEKSSEALVALYGPEKDLEVRRAIIGSLRSLNNAKSMVDIARVETDMKMKQAIVETLSHMKSKEASDYLLELLNK